MRTNAIINELELLAAALPPEQCAVVMAARNRLWRISRRNSRCATN